MDFSQNSPATMNIEADSAWWNGSTASYSSHFNLGLNTRYPVISVSTVQGFPWIYRRDANAVPQRCAFCVRSSELDQCNDTWES